MVGFVRCSQIVSIFFPTESYGLALNLMTTFLSAFFRYMYKRLRFLGNKQLSQVVTLVFLAVWHGFYSGYYVNFFLEFITVFAEKQVS